MASVVREARVAAPAARCWDALRAFAEHQPVTSIVNAIRDLLGRQPAGSGIWIAVGWCAGILVVAYVLADLSYRRKIS